MGADTGLNTSDPDAGGGRSFFYEWEIKTAAIQQEIDNGGGGGGGGTVASFTFTQSSPSAQWVIDHHLGFVPNVVVVDGSGEQMVPEIYHPSNQTTVITHSKPYSGTAYLRP